MCASGIEANISRQNAANKGDLAVDTLARRPSFWCFLRIGQGHAPINAPEPSLVEAKAGGGRLAAEGDVRQIEPYVARPHVSRATHEMGKAMFDLGLGGPRPQCRATQPDSA